MPRLAKESGLVLAGLATASILGLLTNQLRTQPLPMGYEGPQERMIRAVSGDRAGAPSEPETIDFKAAMESWKEAAALFVDARGTSYFADGHIPRSVNVPRDSIVQGATMEGLPDKSRPVIVYCSGEDCSDSRLVAQALLSLGYTKVAVYSGGWEEWEASGSPVEK